MSKRTFKPSRFTGYSFRHPRDIDENKTAKLFIKIQDGNITEIRNAFSEFNATFNVRNKEGQTLIHSLLPNNEISIKDKYNLTEYLLQHGVPPNEPDKNNVTAIHIASGNQLFPIIELLLKYGSEISPRDNQSMTPMHYCIQGKIVDCKTKKRVNDLILRDSNDQYKSEEIKKLTKYILEKIKPEMSTNKDDVIKRIMYYMFDTVSQLRKMFKLDIDKHYNEYINSVNTLMLKKDISEEEKINLINSKVVNLQTDIATMMKNKLDTSLKSMNIKSNQIDGWGPDDETKNNILDKDYNVILEELREQHKNRLDLIKKNYHEQLTQINSHIGEVFNNAFNIHENIVNACVNNYNLYINNPIGSNVPGTDVFDPINFLTFFIPVNLEDINYDELMFRGVVNVPFSTPFVLHNNVEMIRGTRKQIERWRKQNIRPRFYKISVDNNNPARVGPIVVIPPNAIVDIVNTIQVPQNNVGTYANNSYTIFTELNHCVNRIAIYTGQIIHNNIIVLMRYLDIFYHLEIPRSIIPNIMLGILSVVMLLHKLKKETENPDILSKIGEIESTNRKYRTTGNLNAKRNYDYSYENIGIACDNILNNLSTINDSIDNIYNTLQKFVAILNDTIEFINNESAIKYIDGFHIFDNTTGQFTLDDVFVQPIEKLTPLPESFTDIENIYNSKSIDIIRKHFIETYIPYIYKHHSPEYISSKSILNNILDPINNTNVQDNYKIQYINVNRKYDQQELNALGPFFWDVRISLNPDIQFAANLDYRPGYLLTNYYLINLFDSKDQAPRIKYKSLSEGINDNPTDIEFRIGNYEIKNTAKAYQRYELAIPTLRGYIDQHINVLKYMVVQNIITFVKENNDTIDDIKNEIKEKYQYPDNDMDSVLYTLIGTITDALIIAYLNSAIYKTTNNIIQNIHDNDDNDDKHLFAKAQILLPDTGFKLKFVELFGDIIKNLQEGSENFKDNLDKLKYDNITMKQPNELEDFREQISENVLININYDPKSKSDKKRCHKIDLSVLETLIKYGCNINSKDYNGNSPIFYAIELQHVKSCEKLIEYGAIVSLPISKNLQMQTPLDHALKIYRQHNQLIYNKDTFFQELIQPYQKELLKELKTKEEYGNNVIRYIEIIYPQLIIMYNNLLSDMLKSYYKKWTNDKQIKLEKTLHKYNSLHVDDNFQKRVPSLVLTDGEINELLDNINNYHVIKNNENQTNSRKDKYEEELQRLYEQKLSLNNKIIQNPEDKIDYAINQGTNKKIQEINTTINEYKKAIKEITDNQTKISNDHKSNSDTIKTDLKDGLDEIMINSKENNYETKELYETIFEKLSNLSDNQFDYFVYNHFWKLYINSNYRLKHMDNIHFVTSNIELEILTRLENTKKSLIYSDSKPDIDILSKLYIDVFENIIEDYTNLPKKYDSNKNYMMVYVINIITHIAKHVIFSNFYYTILKTLSYFIYQQTGETDFNKFNSTGTLESYIIDKLPLKAIKYILGIYKNNNDKNESIKSVTDLFNPILEIINKNPFYVIQPNSSLINKLNTYIFPYYRDLLSYIIPKMFSLINNYNNLILNSSRHMQIINILLNKAVKEN